MFSSSIKICLFFLLIFVLFQLNNACDKLYDGCRGRGQGSCCAGLKCRDVFSDGPICERH